MIEESNYGVELVMIGAHNGNKIQNLIRSTVGKIILVEPVRDFTSCKKDFKTLIILYIVIMESLQLRA